MKRITAVLLLMSTIGFAQKETLTLDSCIQMAKRNYPLLKQNNLISENEQNTMNAATKNWLPKLSFVSKATYQSEVISFMGTSFPNDSYIAALDLEQSVFEGGMIHQQKQLSMI